MLQIADHHDRQTGKAPSGRFALRRLLGARDGAAAIEFAILAIPYFLIVFAIIETFVAYTAEQLVSNAVEKLSRDLRTGRITYGLNRATDKSAAQFRQLFCDEVSILIRCTGEDTGSGLLYLDVRSFDSFADIPTTIPRQSTDLYADIDTSSFRYAPGGAKTINMVRAYYRWQVITDLVRPYITNIRPADGSLPTDFLIVATSAFQNEDYP